MSKFRRRPIRPADDPHFTWQEGDVTFNIPIEPVKESAVPKQISTQKAETLLRHATRGEREMYQRYVAYFDTGKSPYADPAPLPFYKWLALKPQERPGGPEVTE